MYDYDRTSAIKSKVIQDVLEKSRKINDPDIREFQKEVENIPYDDNKGLQGPSSSLHRAISLRDTYGGSVRDVFEKWKLTREGERKARELADLKARTYVVQYYRGSRLGKKERMPKEDINTPWKPGHIIVDEKALIRGEGFDRGPGPSFSVRSLKSGSELPQGTVKGKRLVETGQGLVVQYLVKPRSARAQKKYEAKIKLRDLESKIIVNRDRMSAEDRAEMRAEIERLKKIVG